jgi:branched-chain amino acid transport system substrate-binding protein
MEKKTRSHDITRRGLLAGAAAGAAALVAGFPAVPRAQARTIRIGLVHPVTGFLAYNGAQCRAGCLMAIEDINKAGGIRSMAGAKLEALLGDAQSKPEVGAAEVEKMAEAGADAFSGCFSSSIGLAATQAAAKYNIPFSIDVGVSDRLTDRGLKNVFRFSGGYGSTTEDAVVNLDQINKAAGSPAKSAVLVHEESEFGTGTARLLSERLPGIGIEVLEVIKHANPTRNFDNVALRIRSLKPDLVIPSNYLNEYILLARTLKQQKIDLAGIYSVLGGGFSLKFVKEQPDVAEHIIDFNHWYDPKKPAALEMRKRVEAQNLFYTFEIYLSYNSIKLLADAFERAGTTDRDAVNAALAASTFSDHFMPYGPTKFVNGQNQGARALALQALGGDVKVIFPKDYAEVAPVFPRPKA